MAQIWRLPSQRKARPAPPTPTRIPAVAVALADEFRNREFGFAGETTAPRPPAPPPTPVRSFVIEPWGLEEQMQAAEAAQPSPTRPSAIEELMAREMAIGAIEEPRPLGPPAPKLPPLPRPVPPKPDWELEEKLAIARNKRERLEQARRVLAEEHALAEEQPTQHPPPRREPS